jgi:hypothetical protein
LGRAVVAYSQPLPFLPVHGEPFVSVFFLSYEIVSRRTDAREFASLRSLVPARLRLRPRLIDAAASKQGKHHTNKLVLALAPGTIAVVKSVASASAATAPCEDTLQTLRSAEAAAKLCDADKTRVSELETKGIERCKADDDKRADDFFAQAMKVLGK